MMMIIHEVEEEEELEVFAPFLSFYLSLSIFALVVSCCLELIYISLSAV
jgi:hypothetical protein